MTLNDIVVRKYFEGYKLLNAKKKHLEKKLQKTIFNMSDLGSMDYSRPNVTGGPFNDASTQITAMLELQRQIEEVKSELLDMDETITMVNEVSGDESYSKMLKHNFIDGLNIDQVSIRLDKSVWTLYKKRKEAINYLAFIIKEEVQLDEEDIKNEDTEEDI